MTIRQPKPRPVTRADGSVAWTIRVDIPTTDGTRKQQLKTFTGRDAEKAAAAELRRIQVAIEKREHVVPAKRTIADLAEEWLPTKDETRKSTRRGYRDALRPLLEAHGTMPVQKLDSKHLEALKRAMKSGTTRKIGTPGKPLTARTINGTLQAVSMMLAYAVGKKYLADNQALLVARVQSDAVEGAAWEPEEATAFLEYVREHDSWRFGAWMCSLFGMRRGEVLGLRWIDVDLDGSEARKRKMRGPSIWVRDNRTLVAGEVIIGKPKTETSGRKLPLTPEMVEVLRAMRDRQTVRAIELGAAWTDSGFVVVDELGREPHPEQYSDAWIALGKAAGLPRIKLHEARHTAASLMADLGIPIVVAAAWLGQSQTSVTEAYQHAGLEAMEVAGAKLGALLLGSGARGSAR